MGWNLFFWKIYIYLKIQILSKGLNICLAKKIQNNISKKIEGIPIDPEQKKLFDQLQLAKENNKLKTERNLLLKN